MIAQEVHAYIAFVIGVSQSVDSIPRVKIKDAIIDHMLHRKSYTTCRTVDHLNSM